MLRSLLLLLLLSCVPPSTLPVNAAFQRQVSATVRLVKHGLVIDVQKGEMGDRVIGTATGVIMKIDEVKGKKFNLIATARHFCKTPEVFTDDEGDPVRIVLSADVFASNYFGKDFDTKFVAFHNEDDICFLSAEGDIGESVDLAGQYPNLGDQLTHTGAPEGAFGQNLAYVTDGRFCGFTIMDKVPYMVTSISTVGGSSGGGIYHNGQLVSILVKSNVPYATLSFGVPLNRLRIHLDTIIPVWRSKRQSASKTSESKPSTKQLSTGSTGPSAPT